MGATTERRLAGGKTMLWGADDSWNDICRTPAGTMKVGSTNEKPQTKEVFPRRGIMKKLVLVISILMCLPFTAFAMEPLSEAILDDVTGQAGVSIAIDDIKLYQNIEYLRYTDTDGTNGTAGSVGISNLQMMVHMNGITSLDTTTGLPVSPGRAVQGFYNAAFDYSNGGTPASTFEARALTIDAGTTPVLSAGLSNNTGGAYNVVAGVRIGLPTLEIYQSALSFDVTVASTGAANDGASYGRIEIGANTLTILDGVIEIAPH
jgi:hypothetical protein